MTSGKVTGGAVGAAAAPPAFKLCMALETFATNVGGAKCVLESSIEYTTSSPLFFCVTAKSARTIPRDLFAKFTRS
jgi:hypothetical protein